MSFNPGGGGIANANDVALSNPATGQVLKYNSGVAKWQNGALATIASSGALSDATGTAALAQLPAGSTFSILWDTTNNVWKDGGGSTIASRPSSRTDITMIAKGGATGPSFGVSGDIWLKDNAL